MSFRRLLLVAPLAFLLAGCDDDDDKCPGPTCPLQSFEGRLYVVNAAPALGNIRLYVDEVVAKSRIEPSSSSGTVWLNPGQHTIALERPGTGIDAEEVMVEVRANAPRLIVALPNGTTYEPLVIVDTGSIVPEGATKVRVVHGAEGAPAVDVWRTQPDAPTPTRVMTPFPLGAASNYIQSTPGTWTVIVTARNEAATTPTNPLATASLTLAAGQRGSFVLVPGTTAGTWRLLPIKEF